MKKSMMRGFILIMAVSLLLCSIICAVIFDINITDNTSSQLQGLAKVIADEFDPEEDNNTQAVHFGEISGGVRVTVIAPDGTVTGDSAVDYKTMGSHADREEIKSAAVTKTAVAVRKSDTIGKKLLYAVQKTEDGYYIRLAREYSSLMSDIVSFAPAILASAVVALIIAAILARRLAMSISGPIVAMNDSLSGVKDGSTILDPKEYPYEELQSMAGKINYLASDISLHIQQLQESRDKINYILDYMKEGFVLLDSSKHILMINNSACSYLGCDKSVAGKDILYMSRNLQFVDMAADVLDSKQSKTMDITASDGKILEAHFSAVEQVKGDMMGGVIIILTDVTSSRNAACMRRDFFSNASHELKTPITSIKGSVELLCSDIPLSEEQRSELLTRIGLETDRMCTLIGDIIMINRLESGEIASENVKLDLMNVINECCSEAKPIIDQGNITINKDLQSAEIFASPKNMHELVSNLLVNAVKYNCKGGSIDIVLKNEEKEIVFSIRNDGECIPKEHQKRVFERFYRVDKGRSKTVGGTGLGLSIVKHVVDRMDGTIELESSEIMGTRFTVHLPK